MFQEERSLEDFAKLTATGFEPAPRFELVADLQRRATTRYDRCTAYLLDSEGVVRQIFPMTVHDRASWDVVLDEVQQL